MTKIIRILIVSPKYGFYLRVRLCEGRPGGAMCLMSHFDQKCSYSCYSYKKLTPPRPPARRADRGGGLAAVRTLSEPVCR